MAKIKQRELARELYLQTDKSQKEIATMCEVSEKTLGKWITDANWDGIKKAQRESPEKIINDLYAELEEINTAIKGNDPGHRFADAKTADARNKIIVSINRLKKEVALPQYVAVSTALIDFIASRDLEAAKRVRPLFDEFLRNKSNDVK